jgi:uncharacterized protein
MAKILLLALAALAIIWFFSGRHKGRPANGGRPSGTAEKIVVCAHCRLHIPESESVAADGHHFCCEEHRKLGAP